MYKMMETKVQELAAGLGILAPSEYGRDGGDKLQQLQQAIEEAETQTDQTGLIMVEDMEDGFTQDQVKWIEEFDSRGRNTAVEAVTVIAEETLEALKEKGKQLAETEDQVQELKARTEALEAEIGAKREAQQYETLVSEKDVRLRDRRGAYIR